VQALDGAPGVHSAYYAGAQGSRDERDARNNARLLAALAGCANRNAHYVCVVVLVRNSDDPEPVVAEGRWHGSIVAAPRGAGGFGYDPLFLVQGRGLTAAELAAEEKNRLSHRGQALARLLERLREETA
jgi:XTP/dITP diphosphohydrolase